MDPDPVKMDPDPQHCFHLIYIFLPINKLCKQLSIYLHIYIPGNCISVYILLNFSSAGLEIHLSASLFRLECPLSIIPSKNNAGRIMIFKKFRILRNSAEFFDF